jgi:hypothetical protein
MREAVAKAIAEQNQGWSDLRSPSIR